MNDKKFSITKEESLLVERLFYIYKSEENFCRLLANELMNCDSPKKEDLLEKHAGLCKKSFVELDYARDKVIKSHLGCIPNNISYVFDFLNREVVYSC